MNRMENLCCFEADQHGFSLQAKCGMTIRYIPQPFSTTQMALGVRFGSLDTSFVDESGECMISPGTAHFLEHKMFDMPDGTDAFDLFASIGASANAFTTNEYTAYICSASDHIEMALRHLLSFVFSPCFTQENIEKEKGIIEQEIVEYEEDPRYTAYMHLLNCMYPNHSIHTEITGTKQAVNAMTASYLERVYRYYYRPSNMVLTVAGKMDVRTIVNLLDEVCGIRPVNEVVRCLPQQDIESGNHHMQDEAEIARPHVALGYKSSNLSSDTVKQGYCLDIAACCLFGNTSPLYIELLKDGYISRDFDGFYEWTFGAGHMIISFDSSHAEYVIQRVTAYLADIQAHIPPKDLFEEIKSVVYADSIMVFDSVSDAALSDLEECMCGDDYFDIPQIIQSITYEDFCRYLAQHFHDAKPYVVCMNPKEENEKEG